MMLTVSNMKLPQDWKAKPTKLLFSILNGSTPSSSEESYWEGEINWATPEDIGALTGKFLVDTRRKITQKGYQNSGTQLAPVGSIVLTTRAPVGNLAISKIPLCTNQGCKTLVPLSGAVYPNYFYYQLLALKFELQSLSTGTTFQELGSSELRLLELLVPPFAEQHTIADYLDRQTAKIDAMIDAKQRLLTLLAEKRRALITQAVTQGIDPNVEMKESGVQWLGRIPRHWEIVKIKHLAKVGNGSTPLRENSLYWKDGHFPWLTSTVVNDDIVTEPTELVTEIALRECHLPIIRPDSVLVAITGEGKTRGKAALLTYQATINQHMAFITPDPGLIDSWFLQLFLSGSYEILRMLSEGTGSTKGALTCEQIQEYTVSLPPLEEQQQIVKYIQRVKRSLDSLAQTALKTIHLLHERRAALIAAAVTGQLQISE